MEFLVEYWERNLILSGRVFLDLPISHATPKFSFKNPLTRIQLYRTIPQIPTILTGLLFILWSIELEPFPYPLKINNIKSSKPLFTLVIASRENGLTNFIQIFLKPS